MSFDKDEFDREDIEALIDENVVKMEQAHAAIEEIEAEQEQTSDGHFVKRVDLHSEKVDHYLHISELADSLLELLDKEREMIREEYEPPEMVEESEIEGEEN